MLKGVVDHKWPPNAEQRKKWMHEPTMAKNKERLEAALFGVSIAAVLPSVEEVIMAIDKNDPNSAGGEDLIQYRALQLMSFHTKRALAGLLGLWWVDKAIHESKHKVEICSLHKKGDRMDLRNKRGIGLVSKLVLIMEMVLITRMTNALHKAGTRSKAQGGATPGVQTMDTVAAIINVISKAYREKSPLFMAKFDIFKFFDVISWKAFENAHLFFSFDKNTIDLARLFWTNFKGVARSRFGRSKNFDIKVGNIQGLARSPFHSCLVLDMFLL